MENGTNEAEQQSGGRRRVRRRWWVVLVVGVLLALGAWQVLLRVLRVEQYRPRIEQEIAELTGLPTSIGALALAWRPIPCLSATEVAVGEGDFRATAERVDVFPVVHALLWREVEILQVAVHGLSLVLPEEGDAVGQRAKETWSHVEASLEEPDSSSPSFVREVVVHRIAARDLVLRLGTGSDPVLDATVIADDVTGDRIGLELDAALPGRLRGSARGTVDLAEGQGVRVSFAGDLATEDEAPLAATFQGSARIGVEEPDTVQLEASGDGLALVAAVGLGEESAVNVPSLSARGAALAALLDLAEGGGVELSANGDAALEGKDLRLDLPSVGSPRLAAGTLTLRGLTAKREGKTLAKDVRAAARLADGALELEDLRGGPLRLRGRIAPDDDWSRFDVKLSGRLTLADAWLHGLGAPDSLREVKGELAIDELAGRFPTAEGDAPLTVRAHLPDGALRIVAEDFEDSFSAIQLRLALREERVQLEGSAHSATLGALTLSGTALPNATRAEGELRLDMGALGGYVPDEGTRERIGPVLAAYGRSRIGFHLDPVSGVEGDYRLRLERAQAPSIDAKLTLRTAREPMLGDVLLTAGFPAAAGASLFPPDAHISGEIRLHLDRDGSTGALESTLDLVDAAIATGRFVDKRAGEALSIEVERGAEKGNFSWLPRHLSLHSATGSVSFALDDGLVAPDLDVDLADWSFLLVDTARASGTIRGSFDSRVPSARLTLSEVALEFSPEVGLDSVDGTVALDAEKWSVRDLRLRGEQTDATLAAELLGERFQGRLIGASLDVDFVRSLLGEIEALRGPPEPESKPLSGSFLVQLDRVGIGTSTGRRLRADVVLDQGDVRVESFGFDTEQGAVTGSATVDAREGEASWLSLEFDARNIGGPFLDDLLDEEPRGIEGTFEGKARFEAPLHDDAKAMFAEASGALVARGRKGTFGKLGLATKLVTVLRSTETLRLKLPTFKDDGLVFDDTWLECTMDRGELTLSHFGLESSSYAVTASGAMDFRKETTRIPIEVNAIKGLTGIVEYIPLANDALKLVNVRLVATGSPFDVKVGIASIQDQLLGVGMVGPNAVINGVGDVLRVMRGKGLKKNGGGELELPPLQPGEVAPLGMTTAEPGSPPAGHAAEAQAESPGPAAPPPTEALPAPSGDS